MASGHRRGQCLLLTPQVVVSLGFHITLPSIFLSMHPSSIHLSIVCSKNRHHKRGRKVGKLWSPPCSAEGTAGCRSQALCHTARDRQSSDGKPGGSPAGALALQEGGLPQRREQNPKLQPAVGGPWLASVWPRGVRSHEQATGGAVMGVSLTFTAGPL